MVAFAPFLAVVTLSVMTTALLLGAVSAIAILLVVMMSLLSQLLNQPTSAILKIVQVWLVTSKWFRLFFTVARY